MLHVRYDERYHIYESESLGRERYCGVFKTPHPALMRDPISKDMLTTVQRAAAE
jgi:hypothetical protein